MSGQGPSKNQPPSDPSGKLSASDAKPPRWIDLSDQQKADVVRLRNNASARKSRQKKKEKAQTMETRYVQNEKRIKHLEKMVDELSEQLQNDGTEKISGQHGGGGSSSHGAGSSSEGTSGWGAGSSPTGEGSSSGRPGSSWGPTRRNQRGAGGGSRDSGGRPGSSHPHPNG